MSRKGWAATFVAAVMALAACGGPPWHMGRPRSGNPAIPPTSAKPSVASLRHEAERELQSGRNVTALRALWTLFRWERATGVEKERLATLLERRVAAWSTLGRPVPRARDLERLRMLKAGRASPSPAVAASSDDDPPADARSYLNWVLGGATLAERLLPSLEYRRAAIEAARATGLLASLLVEEDPTSPESLFAAARLELDRGRVRFAERLLEDAVYHSPDRVAAFLKAARLWEQAGDTARARAAEARAGRFDGPVVQ